MSGLVGWWPLHEWAGRANDLSGNGNHGTVNGATQGVWGVGELTAYSFAGDPEWVDINDPVSVSGAQTTAVWVRTEVSSDGNTRYIYDNRTGGGSFNGGTRMAQLSGSTDFFAEIKGDTDSNVSFTVVDALTQYDWHHVALVWDGSSTASVYVDGSLEDSASLTDHNTATGDLRIGQVADESGANEWIGQMQDFRRYNRALSPSEVSTLYEMGAMGEQPQNGTSRYKFEGDVTDAWGSNDGTINGDPQFVSGYYGQALDFDGNDWVDLPFGSNYTGPITFATWVNFDVLGSTRQALLGQYDGGAYHFTVQYENNGDLEAQRYDGSSSTLASVPFSDVNTWVHVVGVYDGDAVKLYLNGILEDSTSDSMGDLSSADFDLGRVPSGSQYLDGQLDDTRIYPYALDALQIRALYEGWTGLTDPRLHDGSDPDAVSRWRFDGDVTDSWGSNDGTDNTSAGFTSDAIRGQAKSFDGTDDTVNVGDSADWDFGSSNFTISLWTNMDSVSSHQDWMGNYDGSDGWIWYWNSSNGPTFQNYSGSSPDIDVNVGDSSIFSSSTWYHLCLVRQGSEFGIYKNGVKVASATDSTSISPSSMALDIGTENLNNHYYDGDIDDVRIYSRALEPYEVAQLYQWGTRGRDMRQRTVKK